MKVQRAMDVNFFGKMTHYLTVYSFSAGKEAGFELFK